jgi:decaprenyl-phosphate phosphoribosyltransferase
MPTSNRNEFDHEVMSLSKSGIASEKQSKSFISPFLQALRPRQWTKNLIVFAAPLFAFSISAQSLLGSLCAFCLFCCASSSFYLINDIVDIESDRQHPVKCKRAIAAGLISIPAAIAMAVGLLLGAIILGWTVNPGLGTAILLYSLLQVAYNLKLKRTVLLDVITIAMGFVLRAYGGAAATDVHLSPWFLMCTATLALFLGIEKRKAELRLSKQRGKITRTVLFRYSMPLLLRMEAAVVTSTIMTYALWSFGPQVRGASTPWMMLTLPLVVYGIFRYQFLSDPKEIAARADRQGKGGQTERPEEVLLSDRPILLTVVGWIILAFTILFLKQQGLLQ